MRLHPLRVGEGERVRAGGRPAGIGDQNVHGPDLLLHPVDQRLGGVDVAGVPAKTGLGADLVGDAGGTVRVTGGDHDARAFGPQRLGNGAPDPLGRTAHQRNAAGDSEIHQLSIARGAPARDSAAPQSEEIGGPSHRFRWGLHRGAMVGVAMPSVVRRGCDGRAQRHRLHLLAD